MTENFQQIITDVAAAQSAEAFFHDAARKANDAHRKAREHYEQAVIKSLSTPDLTVGEVLALSKHVLGREVFSIARGAFDAAAKSLPPFIAEARYDSGGVNLTLRDVASIDSDDLANLIDLFCKYTNLDLFVHGVRQTRASIRLVDAQPSLYDLTTRSKCAISYGSWWDSSNHDIPSGAHTIALTLIENWRDIEGITALDVARERLSESVAEMTSALNNVPRESWPQDVRDMLAALAQTEGKN